MKNKNNMSELIIPTSNVEAIGRRGWLISCRCLIRLIFQHRTTITSRSSLCLLGRLCIALRFRDKPGRCIWSVKNTVPSQSNQDSCLHFWTVLRKGRMEERQLGWLHWLPSRHLWYCLTSSPLNFQQILSGNLKGSKWRIGLQWKITQRTNKWWGKWSLERRQSMVSRLDFYWQSRKWHHRVLSPILWGRLHVQMERLIRQAPKTWKAGWSTWRRRSQCKLTSWYYHYDFLKICSKGHPRKSPERLSVWNEVW